MVLMVIKLRLGTTRYTQEIPHTRCSRPPPPYTHTHSQYLAEDKKDLLSGLSFAVTTPPDFFGTKVSDAKTNLGTSNHPWSRTDVCNMFTRLFGELYSDNAFYWDKFGNPCQVRLGTAPGLACRMKPALALASTRRFANFSTVKIALAITLTTPSRSPSLFLIDSCSCQDLKRTAAMRRRRRSRPRSPTIPSRFPNGYE